MVTHNNILFSMAKGMILYNYNNFSVIKYYLIAYKINSN